MIQKLNSHNSHVDANVVISEFHKNSPVPFTLIEYKRKLNNHSDILLVAYPFDKEIDNEHVFDYLVSQGYNINNFNSYEIKAIGIGKVGLEGRLHLLNQDDNPQFIKNLNMPFDKNHSYEIALCGVDIEDKKMDCPIIPEDKYVA